MTKLLSQLSTWFMVHGSLSLSLDVRSSTVHIDFMYFFFAQI
uniref:Uncharacterized protein n=1 Tax=Nelumbo nucifera TaxID=4432 RepID=A0A822ZRS2_NELNU|nr:TPA_asm: hypothetical protein HUJ06_017890 [Nelumbo nucifera]